MFRECDVCGRTAHEAGKVYKVYVEIGRKHFNVCLECRHEFDISRKKPITREKFEEVREKFINKLL